MANIITDIQLSGITYQIQGSGGTQAIELTQAQYDALVDKDPNVFYIITDAEAGDLTNYYTKTETNTLLDGKADTATTYTKTEVDTALNGKQATLVSSENIKTINNESILGSGNIDIQGGGKAIEAGRGITITTGETADTVSFNLPISAGTGTNSLVVGASTTANGNNSFAGGDDAVASGKWCFAFGRGKATNNYTFAANGISKATKGFSAAFNNSEANNVYAFSCGTSKANGYASFASGWDNKSLNDYESSFGYYNVSNKANTTFGDSGNTLFSVGNGTADNARHNAFEIRQNGDIYLSLNGQDVKLQDQLGGSSITVDTSLDSGSTNAVANSAITTALNAKSDKGNFNDFIFTSMNGNTGAMFKKDNGGSKTLWLSKINGTKVFEISDIHQATNFSLVETSAITTSLTSSSTDAQVPSAKAVYDQFGGLKLVKLSQSEYDALSPNYDSNTLYVIVN